MKKHISYLIKGTLMLILSSSCNDDFMERYPLDTITEQNFWQSENDLKAYVNNFYPQYITGNNGVGTTVRGINEATTVYGDMITDNAAPNTYNRIAANEYTTYKTVGTGGDMGYSYGNIRSLNIFIKNYNKAPVDISIKNKYLGEVLFFKAWDYFDKVKNWGEVPWLSKPLETNSEELYMPRTPRVALMDSIISNLDRAISNLPEKGKEQNNRVNKEMALFLKLRIGLYEGTFRKYQNTGLDYKKFLKYATEAGEQLMKGQYSLLQGDKNSVYNGLFAQATYKGNPEVILWREYSTPLQVGTAFSRYYTQNLAFQHGATRSLVDDYLCTDGQSISTSPLFKGKNTIQDELQNRDPRLTQTVANFGTYNLAVGVSQGANNAPLPNLPGMSGNKCPTGYRVCKWWYNNPADWDATSNGQQAGLMWRYAEVLLNYAEAKYELGEISQSVIDQTINKLRTRVGMPGLILGQEPSDSRLDQINSKYLEYSINPALREIRRERRIELAFENTRWDDLVRWKAGRLLEVPVEGIKFVQSQFPQVKVGSDIFLSSEGYILPYFQTLPNGRTFNDRQYLFPLPLVETVLNPKLKQNPGW
ncbi:RagB/SusD family nutrient uptake outer membrane protein [Elizabethkingia anophelis]|uniref:RagB/SusD family nutrient uptake outer membrane protein n=1 Tax=Elizabethkingia anophelis TaxID=1117645 RepID=UPI003891415E